MIPQIVGEEFENVWIDGEDSDEYHADHTAVGSSKLRQILKSPAAFLAKPPESQADHFNFGSMFHMALLEPEKFYKTYIILPDFGDLRSPKNRKERDDWKAVLPPGTETYSEDEFRRMEGMLTSVTKHRDASILLKTGMAEVSGYYRDPETGIKCKIKPDFLNLDLMAMIDVKTTQDCSAEEFAKTIWKYRYDIQMAMYCDGVQHLTKRPVHFPIFMVVEKNYPLYNCDGDSNGPGIPILTTGMDGYRNCLKVLHECLTTNKWPNYQKSIQNIYLPQWVLKGNKT